MSTQTQHRGRSRLVRACLTAATTLTLIAAAPSSVDGARFTNGGMHKVRSHTAAMSKDQMAHPVSQVQIVGQQHKMQIRGVGPLPGPQPGPQRPGSPRQNSPSPSPPRPALPNKPAQAVCKYVTITSPENSVLSSGATTQGLAAGYKFKLSPASALWDVITHSIILDVFDASVTFTGTCSNHHPFSQVVPIPNQHYSDITRTYGKSGFCPQDSQVGWETYQSALVPLDVAAQCGPSSTMTLSSSTFSAAFSANLPLVGISGLQYHTFADHISSPNFCTGKGTPFGTVLGDFITVQNCAVPTAPVPPIPTSPQAATTQPIPNLSSSSCANSTTNPNVTAIDPSSGAYLACIAYCGRSCSGKVDNSTYSVSVCECLSAGF